MKKEKYLKYSSEGIPFPPNMGMDEKDGCILFYDKTGEFTEIDNKPRAFINLENKTLTFYSKDEEKWKTVDYSNTINSLNKVLFETKNNLNANEEDAKIFLENQKKIIWPHLNGISDMSVLFGVSIRYTHYKFNSCKK